MLKDFSARIFWRYIKLDCKIILDYFNSLV